MKTVKDYDITLPYLSTKWPYSRLRPHRGEDRGAPKGTPVVVGNLRVGKVGSTGFAFGSHVHIAKWWTQWGNYLINRRYYNPKGWSNLDGRVVYAGWLGTAGKCVIIKRRTHSPEDKRVFFMFAHLDEITCKKGDWTK